MHRLERLAVREAKKTRDTVPELLTATDSLVSHMQPRDWEMLQSFNDKFGLPDLLEHFYLLRNWLVDSRYLRDWGITNSSMTTYEMRTKAEAIAKRVKSLSRDIEMLFPELCEPYSIHAVVEPVSWVSHLDYMDASNSEAPEEEDLPFPIAFDPRLGTLTDDIEADCTELEQKPKRDFLFGLWQEAGDIATKLRHLSRYGLTPAVAGKNSLLEHLHSYITQHAGTLSAPPKSCKHPIWCRNATFRLANKIDRSDFFRLASKTQKQDVIEYTILATAHYHDLVRPNGPLGSKYINSHSG